MNPLDLARRNTTSKKTPEIDSLYAYATRHAARFTHRHQLGSGYKYTNHKAIINANDDEIHIYHRTVTINGVTKGLTMVTKNSKVREVQKWFTQQVKEIEADSKREHAANERSVFDIFSHAKSTPIELGMLYTY